MCQTRELKWEVLQVTERLPAPNVLAVSQAASHSSSLRGLWLEDQRRGFCWVSQLWPGHLLCTPHHILGASTLSIFYQVLCVGFTYVYMCLWIHLCVHVPVHTSVYEYGCLRLTLGLFLHEPLSLLYSLM